MILIDRKQNENQGNILNCDVDPVQYESYLIAAATPTTLWMNVRREYQEYMDRIQD
jgi:hypothetical protein